MGAPSVDLLNPPKHAPPGGAAGQVQIGKGAGNAGAGAAGLIAVGHDQQEAPVAAVGEGRGDCEGAVRNAAEHLHPPKLLL